MTHTSTNKSGLLDNDITAVSPADGAVVTTDAVASHGEASEHANQARNSKLKNIAASIMLALGTLGGGAALTSCGGGEDEPEPVQPVETKLTAEQQKFADLLAPNADGTPKSISIDIGDPSSPFYMPGLFRIELKLIDAKAGTFSITPYISKAPIANALNNAEQAEPGKSEYASSIALMVKRSDGSEYSPTNTVVVVDRDDHNPNTLSPYLDQLPDVFTFDIFKQFNPNNNTVQKNYTLNKTDELQLWIETATIGRSFGTIKLPIKPVEISAIQNNGK